MIEKQPISKRLKELRLEAGLSQKKLGIEAGIDEFSASARMNQYEKGKHVPDFNTIKRFADILSVPSCYFYVEEDDLAMVIKRFGDMDKDVRKSFISKLEL